MTAVQARLVIGVTGHRRLAGMEALSAKIDAIIDEIVREVPARLVVLSPLAEGADRLVAERVLSRERAGLEAVLPMPEADYERDFETDGSRAEFRSLLARAEAIHRLPNAPSREEAYAAAGRFVVDRCDVLIAVWDGKAGDGPGGTAETVGYARSVPLQLLIIEP